MPLQGPPGTEFVLVCARRDKPVTRREIEAILKAGEPLPPLPDRVMLRLRSHGVEPAVPPVSRSIGAPVESDLSAALSPLRTCSASSKMRRLSFRESPSRTWLINRLVCLIDGGSSR